MHEDEFVVVKNHEDQYSIWLARHTLPSGWQVQPARGTREQCLDYVRKHWVDMRPASLIRRMPS
jgi:MbtH protein